MTWQETVKQWENFAGLDEKLAQTLQQMTSDEKEEAFIHPLSFGTAGMRGILGPGINRMNIYTVRQATQGLADFIKSVGQLAMDRGVVIAYDSRHMSPEFAQEAAAVLAFNDIRAFVFESLRPTPTLSFAVRHLNTYAGIMITASHNPAEYNGYKVYGQDGGQMPPKEADQLTAFVRAVTNPLLVEVVPMAERAGHEKITMVSSEIDQAYLKEMESVQVNPSLNQTMGGKINIVYTPLHGTGLMLGLKTLEQSGFSQVHVVESQAQADGDFPTVKSPNPESYEAFHEAEKLAKQVEADIILATDPDADRLGAMIRNSQGEYQLLTGNQIASLMLDYLLKAYTEMNTMPANPVAIKSIVSTDLASKIAAYYGVQMLEVLTGFKFIAEKIKEFEADQSATFVLGFEESYGYLVKAFARDKDALQAMLVLSEMTAYHKKAGKDLSQVLEEIYQEHGYFEEKTISITFSGISGTEQMKEIMTNIHENKPTEIGQIPVAQSLDYLTGQVVDRDGKVSTTGLPQSDALKFKLDEGSWVALRPSGTEPKLKLYIGVTGENRQLAHEKLTAIEAELRSWTKI